MYLHTYIYIYVYICIHKHSYDRPAGLIYLIYTMYMYNVYIKNLPSMPLDFRVASTGDLIGCHRLPIYCNELG